MPAQEVIGKVVSDKMQKSVVVAVERKVRHGALRQDAAPHDALHGA